MKKLASQFNIGSPEKPPGTPKTLPKLSLHRPMDNLKARTIYGRRQSRPLRQSQKNLWENLFNDFKIDLKNLPNYHIGEVVLEIGFGNGENLAYQAIKHPQALCIGCEPFVNGVASLLAKIAKNQLTNIRIFNDDAKLLLAALPNHFTNLTFILFPDPWPKKRHHRRRFITMDNLLLLHQKMKKDGELVIATDHPEYLTWILNISQQPVFLKHFQILHTSLMLRPSEAEIPLTKYEKKALENRPGAFLKFRII